MLSPKRKGNMQKIMIVDDDAEHSKIMRNFTVCCEFFVFRGTQRVKGYFGDKPEYCLLEHVFHN